MKFLIFISILVLVFFMAKFSQQNLDVECDENYLKDFLKLIKDKQSHVYDMLGIFDSFFKRLNTNNFCEATPKCSDIYEEPEEIKSYEESYPSSCAEAIKSGAPLNRTYRLQIPGFAPFFAYCIEDSQKNGSAWTILIKREDGSIDFDRDYIEYKYGFGNPAGEYWIGLDAIHAMTYFQPHELWIHVDSGKIVNEKFNSFAINDEESGYEFNILGESLHNTKLSKYFQYSIGNRFSTKNQDYTEGNCLQTRKCSWWFHEKKTRNCSKMHLTGIYGREILKGIFFEDLRKVNYVFMAIRPVELNGFE